MGDKQTAAILVGIAVVWFVIWYRQRSEGERAHITGYGATPTPGSEGQASAATGTPLDRLLAFAGSHGLTVTSTTGGGHNRGSLHYQGRAIDVRTGGLTVPQIADIIGFAAQAGISVRDERMRPSGQGVWSGPHLHLYIPG